MGTVEMKALPFHRDRATFRCTCQLIHGEGGDALQNLFARTQAGDTSRLDNQAHSTLRPHARQEEHENFALFAFEENWQSVEGNPVRFCTERDLNHRLVVNGPRSWYVWSDSDTRQSDQANKQPEENSDHHLLDIRTAEHNLIALICLLVVLLTLGLR